MVSSLSGLPLPWLLLKGMAGALPVVKIFDVSRQAKVRHREKSLKEGKAYLAWKLDGPQALRFVR